MTELQAQILYAIVQYGKLHGMYAPTAKYLADHLQFTQPGNPRGPERNMNAHINRLGVQFDCFQVEKRRRFVNSRHLVTEPESAAYLLEAVRMSEACLPEGRVGKAVLHQHLADSMNLDENVLEAMYSAAIKNDYLELVTSAPGFVRPGFRTNAQFPYLRLLASGLTSGRKESQ